MTTRTTTRRTVLRWGAAVSASLVVPSAGVAGFVWAGAGRGNVGTLTFRNRLPIPPELDASPGAALTLRSGESRLLPGPRTPTWGANGSILGPTLRARRGARVSVAVTNRLPETTSLHWHGMHLPAIADGGPHQPIAPGATWRPTWTIDQRAATLWYHPHLHRTTARHVYRGIAGLFLIDDERSDTLPHDYGVDDIPLIVQDRNFTRDGRLDEANLGFGGLATTGLLGDTILVNGGYDPFVEVVTRRVRFRLVNGSNARVYSLGFTDHRAFTLVATDAGWLETPVRCTRLRLSPGERAEIVVAFDPGERVVLRSFAPRLGGNLLTQRLAGGDDTFDLVQVRAAATLRPSPAVPERLTTGVRRPAITVPEPFRLDLGEFHLNGAVLDHGRIDRRVAAGSVERWEIRNPGQNVHNVHVHGASFHLLDRDGAPPPEAERGEKDTVFVPANSAVTLAVRYGTHVDARSPYMYHCHLLAHEDAGMMGQYVVVGPGAVARAHRHGE
ncbi:multicopper oxidase family protein [Cryptosporangium arvum]|uniref:multicopper oxidase family protein n=1 Tax=Cryptosporangium arvum TaxID=80871 RepID=UPI0006844380|nr:multicopper oxidase domain-containing protein [Cryptosporangium arvum]